MSSNEYCTLNCPCSMQFGTPTDISKRSATSTSPWSRHLRRGTSKDYQNFILEGMLEVEHEERCKLCKNCHKAMEQCLDIGIVIYKIAQNLQQATNQLRSSEGLVDAAADLNVGESYVLGII
ncbi:hypothetical protein PanWU01x14_239490 [Parasponia andersonii]|uniref:Uncharacterized protein n=1 Tax=Parasponia andersonii TaxID=3476 RepID=A0A2P5BH73_PARAD|nr:hypothetical protein PanWU01x14_239490 [Parasponia andersonii]